MVGTMPINVLQKKTPRGRGPEPKHTFGEKQEELLVEGEEALKEKESDLADLETQALWESQEIGNTSWSGAGGTRYSDPD
jgi:hypothetical protein